jgi:hypothetical protein
MRHASPAPARTALATLAALAALALAGASPAAAYPHRGGANHHLGDDSFVARYRRAPTAADGEKLRMRVHLEHVRELLAARPATSPPLAGRRAELLGYLGDYIARGITPRNTYVPWRNPVFIDAEGAICAVGYLIERSAGRALPERIAAAHRLDYLEDIAAAMPEVAAWARSSGLSLDELASIQPGYEGPDVQHLDGWNIKLVADGPYSEERDGAVTQGRFKRKEMTGAWKRTAGGKVIGSGTFRAGAGTWRSLRLDGTKLAEGAFARSRPEGEWRFFFSSGRLAAVGAMHKGKRDGQWTFFHDQKGSPRIATGLFDEGEAIGDWQHFDAAGRLVATASGHAWSPTGLTLNVEPRGGGVRHTVTQGEPATDHRLDGFFLGPERLYIRDRTDMFDGQGNRLAKTGGAWTQQACTWTARRKRTAAAGDVWTLYKMLIRERYQFDGGDPATECRGAPTPIAAGRARRLDAILASRGALRTAIPAWGFKDQQLPEPKTDDEADGGATDDLTDAIEPAPVAAADADAPIPDDNSADMATYLAEHMTWYMEWPHVDETFLAVYRSLPGYGPRVYDY